MLPLRRRGVGGVLGRRVLTVCGGEHVIDGDLRAAAGVGLREAAAGGLDLAYLLGEWAVRVRLCAVLDPVADEGYLQVALEGADLAAGGTPGLALVCSGVGVPSPGEGAEVGPAAVAVGGEHRADAAALVHIGADDHAVGANAAEHRGLGLRGHGVDRVAEALGVVTSLCHD